MALVSANAMVCERALHEKDNVASLIRVVEVFFVPKEFADDPPKHPIPMTLYVNFRVTNDDDGLHSVAFALVRPDGESVLIPAMEKQPFAEGNYPGQHRSVMAAGQIGVVPKQMGIHYFAVMLDDAEIARVYFTLLPADAYVAIGTPN